MVILGSHGDILCRGDWYIDGDGSNSCEVKNSC
jgi:hypothetical protein